MKRKEYLNTSIIILSISLLVVGMTYYLWTSSVKTQKLSETYEITRTVATLNTDNKTAKEKVKKPSKTTKELPILMYHFFYDASSGEIGENSNWMEISDFEKQMKYLSKNNYYFPTWEEVYEFVEGTQTLPNKSIVITIDDGHDSFFRLAVHILEKYNITATSFVITKSKYLSKNLSKYKSETLNFESHSNDMHRAGLDGKGRFLTIGYDEAYKDLSTSKKKLGSSDVFCYPYGHYNDFTKKMLKITGYKLAVTTIYGKTYPGMDRLELPRIRMSKDDSLASFISKIK